MKGIVQLFHTLFTDDLDPRYHDLDTLFVECTELLRSMCPRVRVCVCVHESLANSSLFHSGRYRAKFEESKHALAEEMFTLYQERELETADFESVINSANEEKNTAAKAMIKAFERELKQVPPRAQSPPRSLTSGD